MVYNCQQKQDFSFRGIYNSMNRRAFVKEIATLTQKSESTIYNWISGKYSPDCLSQSHIANYLGIPAEVLFPEKKEAAV